MISRSDGIAQSQTQNELLAGLGQPFEHYLALLFKVDDARKRLHALQVDGSIPERAKAELELMEAYQELAKLQDHSSQTFLHLLRQAHFWEPENLAGLLRQSAKIDVLEEQLHDCRRRIQDLECGLLEVAR